MGETRADNNSNNNAISQLISRFFHKLRVVALVTPCTSIFAIALAAEAVLAVFATNFTAKAKEVVKIFGVVTLHATSRRDILRWFGDAEPWTPAVAAFAIIGAFTTTRWNIAERSIGYNRLVENFIFRTITWVASFRADSRANLIIRFTKAFLDTKATGIVVVVDSTNCKTTIWLYCPRSLGNNSRHSNIILLEECLPTLHRLVEAVR